MKITQEIPDVFAFRVVNSIMENFPEASRGCALKCIEWKYAACKFRFVDEETGKRYTVQRPQLLAAFALMFTDKWPKGLAKPPLSVDWETWEEWLCAGDAIDCDAFAQLACLGEVIYG